METVDLTVRVAVEHTRKNWIWAGVINDPPANISISSTPRGSNLPVGLKGTSTGDKDLGSGG